MTGYLFVKKNYRLEIERRFSFLFGRNGKGFWRRNVNVLSRNFTYMLFPRIKAVRLFGDWVEKGRGQILVTLHFGIWEILPLIFLTLGYPVAIVAGKQRNWVLEWVLFRIRASRGVRLVRRVSEMVEVLEAGYLLGLAVDNTRRTKGVRLAHLGGLRVSRTPFVLGKRLRREVYSIFGRVAEAGMINVYISRLRDERDFGYKAQEFIRRYPEDWVFWGK